jgi:hypothetical protein
MVSVDQLLNVILPSSSLWEHIPRGLLTKILHVPPPPISVIISAHHSLLDFITLVYDYNVICINHKIIRNIVKC